MGGTLKFFASGNTASLKWIDVSKYNLGRFMALVQSHMNASESTDAATSGTAGTSDVTEQIKKLAELHDAGILTDDEFGSKKRELLNKL